MCVQCSHLNNMQHGTSYVLDKNVVTLRFFFNKSHVHNPPTALTTLSCVEHVFFRREKEHRVNLHDDMPPSTTPCASLSTHQEDDIVLHRILDFVEPKQQLPVIRLINKLWHRIYMNKVCEIHLYRFPRPFDMTGQNNMMQFLCSLPRVHTHVVHGHRLLSNQQIITFHKNADTTHNFVPLFTHLDTGRTIVLQDDDPERCLVILTQWKRILRKMRIGKKCLYVHVHCPLQTRTCPLCGSRLYYMYHGNRVICSKYGNHHHHADHQCPYEKLNTAFDAHDHLLIRMDQFFSCWKREIYPHIDLRWH